MNNFMFQKYERYVFLIIFVCFLFCSFFLFADGCFVWKKGADLTEPSQKAILYWKDGKETLVLQVKYEGEAEDFAWIVPLPNKPEVDVLEGNKSPFEEISRYTQMRTQGKKRSVNNVSEDVDDVVVIERKVVGVFDIAVLSSLNSDSLSLWLNRNGFVFPDERTDVLKYYTDKKWFYVAMRIDRKALKLDEVKKLRIGVLQPVRFKFQSTEMIYPLKISSINASKTEVLLYLLAEEPMVLYGTDSNGCFGIEENMPHLILGINGCDSRNGTFRKVSNKRLPVTWDALMLPENLSLSLCKYRALYESGEMDEDLTFCAFDALRYWEKSISSISSNTKFPKLVLDKAISVCAQDLNCIQRLSSNTNVAVRVAVAANENVPSQVLRNLAKENNYNIKSALVVNPNTPVDIITDININFFGKLPAELRSPDTSSEVLMSFVKSKHAVVRELVARHVNASTEILDALSRDVNENVRCAVIDNPSSSIKLLDLLSNDENKRVSLKAKIALKQICERHLDL